MAEAGAAPGPGNAVAAAPAAPPAETKAPAGLEAVEAKPKGIRPIPDKPRGQSLPGVWSQRGDPQDELIERKRKERAAAPVEGSDSGTDKTAAQPKEEAAKADAPPKQAATPAPESEPFTDEHLAALDSEDADPEKVKHALKTLKGMHRAVLKAKEEAKEVRLKAVKLANDWKEAHDRVSQELEQVRKGATAPAAHQPAPTTEGAKPATAAAEPAAKLLEAIPLDTFEAIVEKHGTGIALTWALEKAQKLTVDHLTALLDSRLAPVEQGAQVTAEVRRVVDTFKGVAEIRDPDSQDYFYPELHDPALLDRVIHVWKELRLPEDIAYSAKGVHTAVIIVRDALGRIGVKAAPTKGPAPATPSPAAEVDKVASALVASLNRGNPGQVLDGSSAAPSRPGNGEVTAEMLIRRGILDAQPINSKLGFGRR